MSISLIFPLQVANNGFKSFTDEETKEAIQQNLKMLILTSPGEYVMDPDFGVGLYNYLFELATRNTQESIKKIIRRQSGIYMPYIKINNIDVNYDNIDNNVMTLRIEYQTSQSVINEVFDLTVAI